MIRSQIAKMTIDHLINDNGGGGGNNFKIYIVSSSEAALTPMKSCWAQFYFWLSNTLYHFLERACETSKQYDI